MAISPENLIFNLEVSDFSRLGAENVGKIILLIKEAISWRRWIRCILSRHLKQSSNFLLKIKLVRLN